MSRDAVRLSRQLQRIAAELNANLRHAGGFGDDIPWVLVCQVDGVAQYVSNTKRHDGTALLTSLLDRWKAGGTGHPRPRQPGRLAARDGITRRPHVRCAYRNISEFCNFYRMGQNQLPSGGCCAMTDARSA